MTSVLCKMPLTCVGFQVGQRRKLDQRFYMEKKYSSSNRQGGIYEWMAISIEAKQKVAETC